MKDILNKLLTSVNLLSSGKVLIIGDIMLDEYIFGEVTRISPEAPIPVVLAKNSEKKLGAAGNVLLNIAQISSSALFSTVCGEDDTSQDIKELLESVSLKKVLILNDKSRKTTRKIRLIARNQQLVRLDWENAQPIHEQYMAKILDFMENNKSLYDVVLLSDYNKGVLHDSFIKNIIAKANNYKKLVIIDPKKYDMNVFRNAYCITPNLIEFQSLVGKPIKDIESIIKYGIGFIDTYELNTMLIKLSERGMIFLEKNKAPVIIPAIEEEVFDVTGAGDTVIALFALAIAAKITPNESAYLANIGASLTIKKLGAYAPSSDEILKKISTLINQQC